MRCVLNKLLVRVFWYYATTGILRHGSRGNKSRFFRSINMVAAVPRLFALTSVLYVFLVVAYRLSLRPETVYLYSQQLQCQTHVF